MCGGLTDIVDTMVIASGNPTPRCARSPSAVWRRPRRRASGRSDRRRRDGEWVSRGPARTSGARDAARCASSMVSSRLWTAARLSRGRQPRGFPCGGTGGGEPRGNRDDARARDRVGTRLPAWVRSACEDYLARLASRLAISLVEIEPGPRTAGARRTSHCGRGPAPARSDRPADQWAILDGAVALSTRELAAWLRSVCSGRGLAF